jgi:cytochrome P450
MADLLDPALFARDEALAAMDAAREADDGVHPLGPSRWAVLRHADAVRVLRDPETFSSARGTGPRSKLDAAPIAGFEAPYASLNASDAPVHGRIRAALASRFDALDRLEPGIRARVARLHGSFDAAELAGDLAFAAFADWFGVADADRPWLRRLSLQLSQPEEARGETTWQAAERELAPWLRELPELEGVVSPADSRFVARLLVETGHGSTAHALAGAFVAASSAPLPPTPGAVEEILRWTSPVVRFGRFVTRDIALGGRRIRAGDRVLVFFPAANRDPRVFENPTAVVPDRKPNPHLAFGAGPHRCIGSSLARLQLRVLLEGLDGRMVIAERTPLRVASSLNLGWKRVPVRID